ncbi:GntR family transcriptional regulator [Actinomadura viridis]|uniref:DNA-binding GntR family transcriptional regulator n=1 Tax=Actinomadura viridis TaxID=58110 RepID=A0A931DCU7_9ACTN|nr:GntR family transcriptional regulator [Actinomadura viridis]MBG6086514.1 DNA-binding GntR family transcriptional regulator [Actinomadura viridis]
MRQPAYLRIADDLRRRIVEGRLAPGDKVPSRHELAREYEVSDRVAVEAVRLLVAEGYLESRSGSGTYVRRRPQLRRLARSWYRESRGRSSSPFRADMESQGLTGTWRSSSETTSASPAVAERLDIPEGAEVMRTRYTFLADDQPVMASTSWEPMELTRGTPVMLPEEGPHAGAGVVARMRAIGLEVSLATEVITARSILAEEADILNEPLGSIVMVIQRTYSGDRPVETADIVVPVDRYELAYTIPVD